MRLGIVVRHKNYNLYQTTNIKKIFNFIQTINLTMEKSLISFKAIYRNTGIKDKYTKARILKEDNHSIIIEECDSKQYKTLFFYNGNFDDQPSIIFSIDIDKDDELEDPLRRIEFTIENIKMPPKKLITALNDFFGSIDKSWYGYYIVTDAEYNNFHSQASWIPISQWDAKNPTGGSDLEEELGFYQQNEEKLQYFITKAYWGNFLNINHIKGLGGIEKIKKEAPVYLTQELFNGGAYLQLTEDINEFADSTFKKKLLEFDNYLKPIIMPNRPNVAWDKM